MSKIGVVKGFKVFNPDWTCKDKQYGCPGRFEEDITPSICNKGMHFCKRASDCFSYYSFDPNNKVAEVIAYGEVSEEGNKCATNKLEVVREIPWSELLDLVNTEYRGECHGAPAWETLPCCPECGYDVEDIEEE
nr:MAG TPA: hypothetical protein [Caudoviricetes sp.]